MANMGRYCKAYPVRRLREFGGWKEDLRNTRTEIREINGEQTEVPRELGDDDHLYLQENFTVTDGVFLDEHVIFSDTSPEWKTFCVEVLKFEIPQAEIAAEA